MNYRSPAESRRKNLLVQTGFAGAQRVLRNGSATPMRGKSATCRLRIFSSKGLVTPALVIDLWISWAINGKS